MFEVFAWLTLRASVREISLPFWADVPGGRVEAQVITSGVTTTAPTLPCSTPDEATVICVVGHIRVLSRNICQVWSGPLYLL